MAKSRSVNVLQSDPLNQLLAGNTLPRHSGSLPVEKFGMRKRLLTISLAKETKKMEGILKTCKLNIYADMRYIILPILFVNYIIKKPSTHTAIFTSLVTML